MHFNFNIMEPYLNDGPSFLSPNFRLFQVVGKIDDTLALLNLVSYCCFEK
jgi:hypothetical protein